MNLENFKALVASSVLDKLPKATQEFLTRLMSAPVETASAGGSMASKGATPKIASVEVPKSQRSPTLRPTLPKEGPKTRKDK